MALILMIRRFIMELLKKMEGIVREAGDIILSAKDIENVTHLKSSAADLVTAYDVKVENFLKEKLLALVPDAIFFGEEEKENQDPSKGWAFIVDPIDGTANFVHNMGRSAVSVALAKDGRVQYAVCLNPFRNEMYTAKRGEGAYLNGRRIHVSDTPIEKGIFSFGTAPYYPELHERTMSLLNQLFLRSCDMRRMGSAVLDLCDVAAGKTDLFFEYRLSPWDYAAGSLLVEEAGGILTTLEGREVPVVEKSSLWATNKVNEKLLGELEV